MNINISEEILKIFYTSHNLLAFSGGIDSSALFFILQDYGVFFDIAIVDYKKREQSKEEISYAQSLAKKYHKKCYVLESKTIDSDFEMEARNVRYNFFHKLLLQYDYNALIMAHHFDDKLEWFFMQFCRGAGLNTLLGFQAVESRSVQQHHYYLVRPLISYKKQDLLHYNQTHAIHFFYDKSNADCKYLRNFFRHEILAKLQNFSQGMQQSLEFLSNERELLYPKVIICHDYNLLYCKISDCKGNKHIIHIIDTLSKKMDYVMSKNQKKELHALFSNNMAEYAECVMGDRIIIAKNTTYLFVGLQPKWLMKMCLLENLENQNTFITLPKKIQKIFLQNNQQYFHNQEQSDISKQRKVSIYFRNDNNIPPLCSHASSVVLESPNLKSSYFIQLDSLLKCSVIIPKPHRELYRKAKIPPKIRLILFFNSLDIWG
ncbi:tRNA lysidine(34) synthetase TilS [Helicobacter didelphidarum]|uniref:tRNA(Ile)-lysidine synthase n=1 Tax=Helicobacter didelphidarum TaxID=2040648 RepID=A0A3D8IP89_9HELI|nr:tRNA lysidine(34) synthetase TilS [Helicobacter didelphidarum]RDU67078.1 tRNA lysidine(34) synthetase TilS [Helicobacter didelphidarum]